MHAMEQMWALLLLQEQLAPDGEGGARGSEAGARGSEAGGAPVPPPATSSKYATYLKIGAGALGGAALLALTGGLQGAGNRPQERVYRAYSWHRVLHDQLVSHQCAFAACAFRLRAGG